MSSSRWYDFLVQNHLANDPQGARVLLVQGLLDTILPPAEESACVKDKLQGEGVPLDVCVDPGAAHSTVTGRSVDYAVRWVEAVTGGTTRPPCGSSAPLPTCTP